VRSWLIKISTKADAGIALLEAAAAAVLLLILFCGGLAASDFLYKGANISEIVDQHIYDTGARVFHTRPQFDRISIELDRSKLNLILEQRMHAIESEILRAIFKVHSSSQSSNGVVASTLYRIEGVTAQIEFDTSNGVAREVHLLNQYSLGSYSPPSDQLARTELSSAINRFVDLRGLSSSSMAIPTGAWGDTDSSDRYLMSGAVVAVRAFVSLDNSTGGWFSRYFSGPQDVSTIKVVPFRGDLDS